VVCVSGRWAAEGSQNVAASVDEMVAAVKAHAAAHYSEGWDVVVECYDRADIVEAIEGCTTVAAAIRAVGECAELWQERRREVESEIF
jgi:hypothetical protein